MSPAWHGACIAPHVLFALTLACAPEADDSAEPATIAIPGHNECLDEGESYSPETCLALVEDDARQPTISEDKAGFEPVEDDPRLQDPELAWVTSEVKRCACACCHTRSYGGPGVYFYDLEWTPVWTDSASSWTLGVFAGFTDEERQTLPTSDLARLQAWVEAERSRRAEID